jgi:hypothetical protein
MDLQTPRTRVLHIDRNNCPEKGICPAIIEIDGLEGYKGTVTKRTADPSVAAQLPPLIAIEDPAIAEAMRPHVGPGEIGSLMTDALYDMIRGAAR